MGTTPAGISYSDIWKERKVEAGSRHRFRVRDPMTKRYESECFENYDVGLAWAKKTRKAFVEGRATAAPLSWAELGAEHIKTLEGIPAHPRHVAQVKQVVEAITKAGARSIADEAFPIIVQRHLEKLRAKRKWAHKSHEASPALKTKFLVIARSICKYAVERGLMRYNPLVSIKLPKVPRSFKPIFLVPELIKLVAPKRTPTDKKWRIVAVLLAYTGVRSTELRALMKEHFEEGPGYCEIPAELPGNKSRMARRFPIQDELRQELVEMPEGLLIAETIRKMSPGNFSNGFKDYCGRCGIAPRGPHAMRHTVASLLTAVGLSPHLVMDYIGHETASVTKHYSRNADRHRVYVSGWTGHQFRLRMDLPHASATDSLIK